MAAQKLIVGIDEVGRGCWAGPLVAATVLLAEPIDGLRDSKKLSKKRREVLAQQIKSEALAYGIGWVTPKELDDIGMTKAVQLAMLRAIKRLQESGMAYDEIVIDGNINYFKNINGLGVRGPTSHTVRAEVRADETVAAVSAASILAKVERDNYMSTQAVKYPEYGFDKHVGYGTPEHKSALIEHGITVLHRNSFRPIAQLEK